MFIRVKERTGKRKKAVQIVKSIRYGKKVQQKVIQTIGYSNDPAIIEKLKDIATYVKAKMEIGSTSLFPPNELAEAAVKSKKRKKTKEDPINVNLKKVEEVDRFITGIHDIYGEIYQTIGFDKVLSKRFQASQKEILHIVMARLACPLSKRASVKMLEQDFGIQLDLSKVYRAMDKIDDKAIEKIQKLACQTSNALLQGKIKVLFYDCTTLYFESFIADELKQNGYSKDGKFNQPQVILALLVTQEGLPIGYEVFPGATFEGNTLDPIIKKLKNQYRIDNIIFVADSAMLSHKNRKYLQENNIKFIVGARLKNLPKKLQKEIINYPYPQKTEGVNKEKSLGIFKYDTCQIISYYSEKRAKKDEKDREKNLEKMKKKLEHSKNAKSLISNFGYQKFIKLQDNATYEIDEEKVKKAAQWDGIGGVITNVDNLEATEIIEQYKNLWQIEACFRIQKTDLKIRPIYHWTSNRIKAHIAICFMAFTCQKYLQYRLAIQKKPLSIERIRNALVHVQLSILYDKDRDCHYGLPSKKTDEALSMYKLFKLNYDITPFIIPNDKLSKNVVP